MKQTILTIITKIEPSKKKELEAKLAVIKKDLYTNIYLPFEQFKLLHFASFVIIDEPESDPLLIFENNFDGDTAAYLSQLIAIANWGLNEIYKCCQDFAPANLKAFLIQNIKLPNAYHIGNVGRTASDVHNNRQLRLDLEGYLDGLPRGSTSHQPSAPALRKQLAIFSKELPDNLWSTLPPHQTLAERVIPWINLSTAFLLAILLAILFLPLTVISFLYLRSLERSDKPSNVPVDPARIEALMKSENRITQNHLASVTKIKPGWFRLNLLRIVLFATNLLARTSNKGKLSGIPSIHFAHWSIINNKQLLFLSNFDGSWSSYLDDFIDKAHRGLTGIWSNTAGFPKTQSLILDGATDELGFKAFARNSQVSASVWYSAYPDLTVQNIDKDSTIRENILIDFPETKAKQQLELF